jgi:hypothetical protein
MGYLSHKSVSIILKARSESFPSSDSLLAVRVAAPAPRHPLNQKLGTWHNIKYRVGCGNETDKD